MRAAIIILAVLGALACGALATYWLCEYGEAQTRIAPYRSLIDLDLRLAQRASQLDERIFDAQVLMIGAVLGLVGGLLAVRRPRWAAVALLSGGLLPVLFEPRVAVFTSLIVAAGLLASLKARSDTQVGNPPWTEVTKST